MITKEFILKNFADAEKLRFSDFMGNDIVLFESNYYDIEIRTTDDGYLVCMHKFNSRDATSENVSTINDAVSFINGVFLNGL